MVLEREGIGGEITEFWQENVILKETSRPVAGLAARFFTKTESGLHKMITGIEFELETLKVVKNAVC